MNHVATHAITIPYHGLLTQTFNVLVLVGVLVYILRAAVAAHFAKRATDYQSLVTKADQLKANAERAKQAVEARLAKLEADAARGGGGAAQEGAQLMSKMQNDAREFAQKIEREADWAAYMVVDKARAQLRRDLLDRALAASDQKLRTGLNTSEQQRLRREFVDKIQVVGQ